MAEGIAGLFERVGLTDHELLVALVLLLLLSTTGWPQQLLRRWVEQRKSDRDRLSEDQQDLLDRYAREVDEERRRHTEDLIRDAATITALRRDLAERDDTIRTQARAIEVQNNTSASIERGAARYRHTVANALPILRSHRGRLRALGVILPPLEFLGEILQSDDARDATLLAFIREMVEEENRLSQQLER